MTVIKTSDRAHVDRLCKPVTWPVGNKQAFVRLVEMGIEESGLVTPRAELGKRMTIRHTSASTGVIAGFGIQGYHFALRRIARLIDERRK